MATKFSVLKQLFSTLPFAEQLISRPFLPLSIFNENSFSFSTLRYHKLYNDNFDENSFEGRQPLVFPPAYTDKTCRFSTSSYLPLPFINGYGSGASSVVRDSRQIHHSAFPLEKSKDVKGASGNITYAIVPKEKPDIISHFLIKHYHQQEPITVALGMNISEVEGWFQRYIRMCMFASLCDVSVQAMDEKRGKRIGVLSSIVIDPTKSRPILDNFTNPKKHPVSAQMNEFYDALEEGLDPVEAAGVKKKGERPPKLLEHLFVSVHPDYTKKGISGQMVKLSESLASNILDCRVGYVSPKYTIATSEFSYAIFLKNGYKVVRESKYADYVNSKGEHIFAGKENKMKPHHSCKAMVKVFKSLYK